MADSLAGDSERMGAMFPKLSAAQLARLRPIGRPRRFAAGEVVYGRGLAKRAFYVLLEGRVEIASPSRVGEERIIVHGAGEFLGEVDMISGRHSLVEAKALDASALLEIDLADLLSVRKPYIDGRSGIEVEVSTDAFVCVDGCRPSFRADVPDDLHLRKERGFEVEKLAPISRNVESSRRRRVAGLGAARGRPYERAYLGQ